MPKSRAKEFLKTDIKIDGIAQLAKFIDQLPKKALKKALRAAVTAASTPISRDARKMAPKLTGTLKKSIQRKVKTYPNGNAIAVVGANRAYTSPNPKTKTGLNIPANYIHLMELGVKPHPQPKNYWFKKTGHPGVKAKDFLGRAMRKNGPNSQKIMEDKMQDVLLKEAAKLASK